MDYPDIKQVKQGRTERGHFLPGVSGNYSGRPKGRRNKATIEAEIGVETLARLEEMSRDELLKLIKAVSGVVWGYALMDDTQKVEAARLKLYNLGMSASEVHKVVPALDKWFDRTVGKAAQAIEMTVKKSPVERLSDDRLAALLAALPDPMIIPPMPKKTD